MSGIDVEEVIGDERRVDEVFGGEGARAVLPVLAKAVEALCALDKVDMADVRGGTFVRLEDARFAWLPGLVHAPSPRFDRERDSLLAKLRAKNDTLATRYGFPTDGRLESTSDGDVALVRAPRPEVARATLIGTFAPPSSVGLGRLNPHVPDPVRRSSATLVDQILDRDVGAADAGIRQRRPTAWTLAALVCDRAGGDGIFCGPERGGHGVRVATRYSGSFDRRTEILLCHGLWWRAIDAMGGRETPGTLRDAK